MLREFWTTIKAPRLKPASISILGTQPFGFKDINSHIYGDGLCKVLNINPFVGSIYIKQQLISLHPIDTKVTSPLKDKGQAITKLADKQVVNDQQKVHLTMKPPSVTRKELHMDKVVRMLGMERIILTSLEKRIMGMQRKARVHQMKMRRSPLGQKNQNPWTKLLEMMKMLLMISNNQK